MESKDSQSVRHVMNIEPNVMEKGEYSNRWPLRIVWLITFISSLHLLFFVDLYAVNLIYHDQWGLYRPMFEEEGIIGAFLYQHGPHRQGLGGVFTYLVAQASDWSTVTESYMIASCLIFATGLLIQLKQRLFGRLSYSDAALPLIVLNLVQIETILITPNVAHSILPLVLLLIIANAWLSRVNMIRYGISSLTAALALFTGFGIFVWVAFLSLLIIHAMREWRHGMIYKSIQAIGCILFLALCGGLFMIGYQSNLANSDFSFPHQPLSDYIAFLDYLFGRLFYLPKIARPYVGFAILFCLVFAALFALLKFAYSQEDDKVYSVSVFFFVASFSFVGFAAIGRVSLGVDGGGSSRYLTLALPAIVALYFLLVELTRNTGRSLFRICPIFASIMVLSYLSNTIFAHEKSAEKRDGKEAWLQAYQKADNLHQAETVSGFHIYPNVDEIEERMVYLRERKLNLFSELKTKSISSEPLKNRGSDAPRL